MAQVTFLQLSPEFGGTRFGPFRGVEIRLGSDPDTNDISLPADLGVAPQHVKVLQQSENTFIIAPIDRTTTVYIWRKNSNKPKQIVTPMAVTPGDSFSLVVPEGARFTIELTTLKEARERADDNFAEKAMKRMPTSGRMLKEIRRRGFAKLFSTGPGNMLMNVGRFVKTGQIFSPVYIIGGLLFASGWFFTFGGSCGAYSLNRSKNTYAAELDTCEQERQGLKPGETTRTIETLTTNILQDNEWKSTLLDDRPLKAEYAKQLVSKFGRVGHYKWMYRSNRNKFAAFDRGIRTLPEVLRSTLSYAAAPPSLTGYKEWTIIEDSEGQEVCARGPLRLTYRQGLRLGLENLQLDRLVTRSIANSQDVVLKRTELVRTAEFEGIDEAPTLDGTVLAAPGVAAFQGGRECLHVEGPDDRTDIGALSRAIKKNFGATARGVPPEGAPYWIGHRLARLAAMDFAYDYGELTFVSTSLGPISNLEAQSVTQKRVGFASRYVADIMTNAVVARCSAVLDREMIDDPPEHMGKLPDLKQCAVIKIFVEYGRI